MQGKVIRSSCGRKNLLNFYVQLKNGGIYQFRGQLSADKQREMLERIAANKGVIPLKHFEKVTKRGR